MIVTATDGLWENLWDIDIIHDVSKAIERGDSLQEMADKLGSHARKVSKSATVFTPLQDEALKAGKYVESTGDGDVTVIVSRVVA